MVARIPEYNSSGAASEQKNLTDIGFGAAAPGFELEQTISTPVTSHRSVLRSEGTQSNGRSEAIGRSEHNELSGRQFPVDPCLIQAHAVRDAVCDVKHQIHAAHERHLCQIGSDLHDGPAQMLALALLRLDALAPAHPEATAEIQDVINHALREIRDISVGLVLPELERRSASAAS